MDNPILYESRLFLKPGVVLILLGQKKIMKDLSLEFIAPGSYIQQIRAKDFNPDPKTSAGSQDENRKERKLNESLLPEGIGRKSFKRITLA